MAPSASRFCELADRHAFFMASSWLFPPPSGEADLRLFFPRCLSAVNYGSCFCFPSSPFFLTFYCYWDLCNSAASLCCFRRSAALLDFAVRLSSFFFRSASEFCLNFSSESFASSLRCSWLTWCLGSCAESEEGLLPDSRRYYCMQFIRLKYLALTIWLLLYSAQHG